MKNVLILFFLFVLLPFCASAQVNWNQVFGKQRFQQGLGLPSSDTANFRTSVDTSAIVLNRADSTVYFRYKGKWKTLASGGSGSGGVGGNGTQNNVAKWSNDSTLTNSIIFDNGTNVGVKTNNPSYNLDVSGTARVKATQRGEIFKIMDSASNDRIKVQNDTTTITGGTTPLIVVGSSGVQATIGNSSFLSPPNIGRINAGALNFFGSNNDGISFDFKYNNDPLSVSTTSSMINLGGTYKNQQSFSFSNLLISPTYNFDSTNVTSSAIARGIYYNPTIALNGLRSAKHIAFQSNSGNVVMKGLKTSNSTTDSIAIWINDTLTKGPYPSGGGGIDSLKRSSDSVYARKNGNFIFQFRDSVGTNPAPVGYYGAFQDTIIQTLPLANTAYPIKARITDLSNGVFLADSTRFVFNNAGIYNLQWSGQFQNINVDVQDARIWVKKNNIDIIGTTGLVAIPKRKTSTEYGHTVAGWNFLLEMNSGDTLQFYWASTSTDVSLQYYPLGTIPPSPTTASMVVTITQQSGIMAGTGITGLGTSGNLQSGANQTLQTSATGSDFTITSASNTQTFNLPTASASNTGKLSSANWTTFNNKLGASDTVSLSSRINNKQTDLDILQSIGYGIKAETYGCTFSNVTSTLALTATGMSFYPFNWNVSDSIRGIAFFNRIISSAVTASNYNGVGIYKINGLNLERLGFTTNSATFWDNAVANSWKTQAFTPFYLAKGTYYIGYQASAASGLPTIASGTIMQTGFIEPPTALNTNNIKVSSVIANTTTSAPSSVAISSTTTVQRIPYFILY